MKGAAGRERGAGDESWSGFRRIIIKGGETVQEGGDHSLIQVNRNSLTWVFICVVSDDKQRSYSVS